MAKQTAIKELKAKKLNIVKWPSQSHDLNQTEQLSSYLKAKLKTETPTNKRQIKMAAVKAWRCSMLILEHLESPDVSVNVLGLTEKLRIW